MKLSSRAHRGYNQTEVGPQARCQWIPCVHDQNRYFTILRVATVVYLEEICSPHCKCHHTELNAKHFSKYKHVSILFRKECNASGDLALRKTTISLQNGEYLVYLFAPAWYDGTYH